MAGGSIDDILERIRRLEATATGSPSETDGDEPAPADEAAEDHGAQNGLADEHHTDDEPPAPPRVGRIAREEDGNGAVPIEMLTPETYRDEDHDTEPGADVAGDEPSASFPFPLGSESEPKPEPEPELELEPESDADPESDVDKQGEPEPADEAVVSVEPEPAAAEPVSTDPGPADTFGAMMTIEPEDWDEPSAEAEPVPEATFEPEPQIEPQLEPDTEPEAETHSEPETEPSPEASPDGAESDGDETDGMVRINPGGASSTGMSDLFTPDSQSLAAVPKTLEDALAKTGVVTREQIAAASRVAEQTPGKDLVAVLREQGTDEQAVQMALASHHGMPFERIDLAAGLEGAFDGTLLQRLGLPFCAEHSVLPLRKEGSRVVVASTKPNATFELDEIRRRLNCGTPKLVLTTSEDITSALEIAGFGSEERAAADNVDLNEILEDVDEADVTVEKTEDQTVDLEQKAGESPVIRYVNYIIQTAVKEGASDIHIEPSEKKITVRLRVDGVLYESMHPPANMSAAITSRIKIMANLDISERRVPQDGRIRCTVQGRKLDLRVSTLPAGYGEKVVMRILDTKSINVQLEDLGFDEDTLAIWRHQVKQAHGIVLVTGPTGSGKTTTLYSSLRQLDKGRLNVSTAEDPIEYHLDGITQTQTHEKIGMTFSRVLKALLRQDPDVIMLGEIRDHETAHIAVQAALTGHLVLSTLHTNDAPSSITRLVNIGLEPFLVGAAVNAVLAQRLVRRLCKHCKVLRDPPPEQVEFLELSGIIGQQVYQPVGCERCRQTGYSGRVGIYELLAVDDQLRDVIARNPNVSEFRRMCLERGMHSLRQDGMTKVADGLTTVAEVLRVTTEH
ncbi:MAG: ATPase, T2SS/T4P/T4SS family [Planctomycetota bacterium]